MAEDKEFDPTLDSVATNAARVMSHVLEKGFQAGGVLGTFVVSPAVLLRRRLKGAPPAPALPLVVSTVCRTVLATMAISGALGASKLASLEDLKAGVEDRAYRLHYNQGQNRTDLFARTGAAAGVATAVALLPLSAGGAVGAAAMGAAAGVLAHVATAPKDE